MGQIGSLYSFAPNTIIRSSLLNSNCSDTKNTFNTHDAALNNVHGISSGEIMGTDNIQSISGTKTFGIGKLLVNTETRYYSISPTAYHTADGADELEKLIGSGSLYLMNVNWWSYTNRNFYAPVYLPHGATVISFKFNYYRNDVLALMSAGLQKFSSTGAMTPMANVIATLSSGNHSETDTSISSPVIDNNGNSYAVVVGIDNNNDQGDALYYSVVIGYTITQPLP